MSFAKYHPAVIYSTFEKIALIPSNLVLEESTSNDRILKTVQWLAKSHTQLDNIPILKKQIIIKLVSNFTTNFTNDPVELLETRFHQWSIRKLSIGRSVPRSTEGNSNVETRSVFYGVPIDLPNSVEIHD